MDKYSSQDHYLDADTGILRNRLGIKEKSRLEEAEATFLTIRSVELAANPIKGTFNLIHLQAIHRHLFCDLYEWAGQIRNIDISKDDTRFAHFPHIETAANALFQKLSQENHLKGLDTDKFAERLAYYLGEINTLHPFRDGNGRAQREFVQQLAMVNGYKISWSAISQQEMIQACKDAYQGNYTTLKRLLLTSLSEH
jgi:cell filamentation protein